MSNYAERLTELTQKRDKLFAQEKRLIEKRKKEIADIAEKYKILTLSDEVLIKCFSELSHEYSKPTFKDPLPPQSIKAGDNENE